MSNTQKNEIERLRAKLKEVRKMAFDLATDLRVPIDRRSHWGPGDYDHHYDGQESANQSAASRVDELVSSLDEELT